MIRDLIINVSFLVAVFSFITGIKLMSKPATARAGNVLSAGGMLVATIATLIERQVVTGYTGIAIGLILGGIAGVIAAKQVKMTAMPEMVALLHGFGGSASLLVGSIAFIAHPEMASFHAFEVFLAIAVGGLTFAGSVVAWAKLRELISGRAIMLPGHHFLSLAIVVALVGVGLATCFPAFHTMEFLWAMIILSLVIGVMAVVPIGGADMPVVISLLNAYSGVAVCATGFAIQNYLLIVAGALLAANGSILTNVMCKAMNRSLMNIVLGGFGNKVQKAGAGEQGKAQPISVEDAYFSLEAANSVVIVPGYGLAVAQAQHAVKELGVLLEEKGCDVRYAIHPVAGRMPGHMNVLLAEAGVPYEQLVEMDEINPTLESVDICIVIGANDTVNPAARDDESSPIYGMPVINVDKARLVFVLKRSMASGFAGIENPLFFKDNTRMVFGDAKATVQGLVSEFKAD